MSTHEGFSFSPARLLHRPTEGQQTVKSVEGFLKNSQEYEPRPQLQEPRFLESLKNRMKATVIIGMAVGLPYTGLVVADKLSNGAIQEYLASLSKGGNLP